MNGDTPSRGCRDDVSVRTRSGDVSRWAWARGWWSQWGDLIKGVAAISACVACIIYAPLVYSLQRDQSRNAKATALAARDGCLRAKALGPSLARDYEERGVLTGEKLALYRSLIPKVCPTK